ncbi:MAG: ribosome silencing factor [Bacteroidota bacterium]
MTASTTTRSTRDRRDSPTPGRDLARIAVEAALDKKAREVTVMDLRGISGEVDYFVLATGESDVQMKAIVEGIVRTIRDETGERPAHREGNPGSSRWIVLDYFDLAVHVFDAEARSHYDLERLWGDAPTEIVDEDADTIRLLDGPESPEAEAPAADDTPEAE